MKSLWKVAILVAIPLIMWFTPVPSGLEPDAWHLLGIYIAAIVGLILKPWPEPVVLLVAIAASSVLLNNTSTVLDGYASTTTWIVFAAFSLSVAFVQTGLGKRMAYVLIGKLGKSVLRLGYVSAILDLVVSPATPSNTARAGGIVWPIMNSVSKALGSEPDGTEKVAGSYLAVNTYMVTKVTSFMFATAMAPNLLAASFMSQISGIELDWARWAMAMVVPGLLLLALIPFLTYIMDRPTAKHVDNKAIAEAGLAELGPMSGREKRLVIIFIGALLGWALPSLIEQLTGIDVPLNATAVAMAAMVACLVTGVLGWGDMVASKGAWSTLIWFGGIIGLSGGLTDLDFFTWLADVLGKNINFGHNPWIALIIIGVLSILVRYLFASGSAYVSAMLPVFLTVGTVAGINPMGLCLTLAATNAYGGSVTHYSGAAAPIIFGAGYNTVKSWWIIGGVVAVVCFAFMMTVGYGWWNLIGLI